MTSHRQHEKKRIARHQSFTDDLSPSIFHTKNWGLIPAHPPVPHQAERLRFSQRSAASGGHDGTDLYISSSGSKGKRSPPQVIEKKSRSGH
jgi:hypothetical protein